MRSWFPRPRTAACCSPCPGTTRSPEEEPRPLKEEIDFILGTAGLYMNPAPTYKDILSVFAGQRPLAAPKKEGKNTKEISRSHKVITSDNGLVTITGGKWTSYRLMAEDTVDKAIEVAGLPRRKCVTKKFHIHGYRKNPNLADHMYVYGSDEPKILNLIKENPALGEKLSPKFGYTLAEVVWPANWAATRHGSMRRSKVSRRWRKIISLKLKRTLTQA